MKRLARKSDTKYNSAPLSSGIGNKSAVKAIAATINHEFRLLCAPDHDSLLRDGLEAVKQFNWETVWCELQRVVPTLMSLLQELVRRPHNSKPFICLIASILLKKRLPSLGLVQRAVSVALYGNGAHKAVCCRLNINEAIYSGTSV